MKIKYFHTTRIHLAVRLHCKINNEKHYCQHANTLDFRQQSLKHTYITSSLLSFPQEMNPCFCYYIVKSFKGVTVVANFSEKEGYFSQVPLITFKRN